MKLLLGGASDLRITLSLGRLMSLERVCTSHAHRHGTCFVCGRTQGPRPHPHHNFSQPMLKFTANVYNSTPKTPDRRTYKNSQPMFIIRHPRHRTGVHTDAVTISSGTPGPPIITAIIHTQSHDHEKRATLLFGPLWGPASSSQKGSLLGSPPFRGEHRRRRW
jgi:hypothetical protein